MDYQKILIEFLLEKANTSKTENPSATMQSDFIGKICMVRTYSAGVFYGEIVAKVGKEVRMKNARRVYYWSGAATLSQLAIDGTSKPQECKFPCTVEKIELDNVIEVIEMTEKAIDSLNEVNIWQAK